MERPQSGYEEMCFYHKMDGEPTVSVYNPDINKGLNMRFNISELKYFTEWKMMGEYDYVLGLEPGNCLPDGRDVMREKNLLEFLMPGEKRTNHIEFSFYERN